MLEGLKLIEPSRHEDARGYFEETYNSRALAGIGIDCVFVQDNHVYSREVGVLRGFHYQIPPYAQDKLIRCSRGAILDVVVDLRTTSKNYGETCAVELSAENGKQFFIPKGFAHGYCTLQPDTEVQYKVSDFYAPKFERGILPTDPALEISWPAGTHILSEKDQSLPGFESVISPF